MFGFDKMFDFNRDGKLDSWERAAQFQFMDEMMKDDEKSILDDDDEIDIFADRTADKKAAGTACKKGRDYKI